MNARARLDAAYEEGQLGAEEYHTRSERAGKAETLAQLHHLVADLQASPGTSDFDLPQPDSVPGKTRRAGYPPHVRARDDDRAATCVLLDAALGDGQLSDDDHRALIELAGAAKTLGELTELTADLQRAADTFDAPRPPRSRRPWFAIAVVAASVVAAVAAFAVVDRPAESPVRSVTVDLGAVGSIVVPTPNLLTAEGITHFIGVYSAKFGDTLVDELTLFDEHASVKRAVPGQPNRQVEYVYWGGFDQRSEPATRKSDTPQFDLAALDVPAFGRLLAAAATTLRVADGKVSHLGFDVDVPSRGGAPVPIISVYVGNEFKESAHLTATPAGVIVRSYPFSE